eukprot:6195584-Pleurochrysis_carterae.AAC.1
MRTVCSLPASCLNGHPHATHLSIHRELELVGQRSRYLNLAALPADLTASPTLALILLALSTYLLVVAGPQAMLLKPSMVLPGLDAVVEDASREQASSRMVSSPHGLAWPLPRAHQSPFLL